MIDLLRAIALFLVLATWNEASSSAAAEVSKYDSQPSVSVSFTCGGRVEQQVWLDWGQSVRHYLQQDLLQQRLLDQGDVYALYDFEIFAHNMVSMARRCHRIDQLREVARLISRAYAALTPGNIISPGRRWICRGGRTCNYTNRLINTEVMLDSVQFLGLATSVANALATSDQLLTQEDKYFIKETVDVASEHLLRWGGWRTVNGLKRLADARPQDVTNGSSTLFFMDKSLWMIAIYSELSGIIQSQDRHGAALPDRFTESRQPHIRALLRLFESRVSIRHLEASRMGPVDVADIDRGYWRLHGDNKYAGYEGEEKPAVCVTDKDGGGTPKPELRVPASAATRRQDIGWDFSHARRLVAAMDALERNRRALRRVFSLAESDLPRKDLTLKFANNLLAVIWNGDLARPLFSNYWNGANGWFRVAYDNGTGECREGYPPYGMTDSFATGGYVAWARYRPEIGYLGKTLYWLVRNENGEANGFVSKYYPSLSDAEDERIRTLTRFAFYSSLIGVGIR
ncbi:hypothetical protein [Noviherbaspirillum massiliense]|uniref:hypothetical protein n=1 Tax=Noviherbaspirillum massiliense TaxID=1465823 RepID=UPI00030B54D3|nr:hypothetical protein [Noviherbaspirillum massiliense]